MDVIPFGMSKCYLNVKSCYSFKKGAMISLPLYRAYIQVSYDVIDFLFNFPAPCLKNTAINRAKLIIITLNYVLSTLPPITIENTQILFK